MKVTRFKRLKNAIKNFDMFYVSNRILGLQEKIKERGIPLEPENTVVAEEAIYYIEPSSGMTAKVALYKPDQVVYGAKQAHQHIISGSTTAASETGTYHLMRCNVVTKEEHAGWKGEYRLVQRLDDGFYCRLLGIEPKKRKKKVKPYHMTVPETKIYEEIESMGLLPCPYCLTKVNSLIDANPEYSQEDFRIEYFFRSGFESTWMNRGKYSSSRGAFADMYPTDWEAIVATKLKQAHYVCEMCSFDMSESNHRRFAQVYTSDYLREDVTYFHLQCLCLNCLSEMPDGEQVAKLPEYKAFQEFYDQSTLRK